MTRHGERQFHRARLAISIAFSTSLLNMIPAPPTRAAHAIVDATRILRDHPLIGRPVRGDIRELVLSSGRTGYVALYRLRRGNARVEILTILHQREAGYRE